MASFESESALVRSTGNEWRENDKIIINSNMSVQAKCELVLRLDTRNVFIEEMGLQNLKSANWEVGHIQKT